MIKFLGSKRVLLPRILAAVGAIPDARSVFDVFSGTARVGHALKAAGYAVTANDHTAYAATLARCYVQADARTVLPMAIQVIAELQQVPPIDGYVTRTFCEQARFFHPENGRLIDAIRMKIAALAMSDDLEAVLLTSLMEAADRVDSTTGVQMAYLKHYAPRAFNRLSLRVPDVLPGPGVVLNLDALDAASVVDADVAYLDPPYNQHSYAGNYHIWETLVRWDAPEAYGVARKRLDCRAYHSPYNSRREIHAALTGLVGALRPPCLVVSFSNEGYIPCEQMEAILGQRGYVETVQVDFRRYVGAQIGVHNPRGERVGRVSHLHNREYLYLVAPDRATVERMRSAAESSVHP